MDTKTRTRARYLSNRAIRVHKLSTQSIRDATSLIREYDEALVDFDGKMTKVFNSEVERLEAERLYNEFLAGNAGKPADYFKLYKFVKKGREETVPRLKDIRMKKAGWNGSIKLKSRSVDKQGRLNKLTNLMKQQD